MVLLKNNKRRRAMEAGKEFEEMRNREVEKKVMAERPDEHLFFVDRGERKLTRSEAREEKRQKFMLGRPTGERLSEQEDRLVKKMIEKQQRAPPAVPPPAPAKEAYDMWGEDSNDQEDEEAKAGSNKKGRKAAAAVGGKKRKPREVVYRGKGIKLVPACHPGQSYNPLEQHRADIVKKAVEVEEARDKAIEEARKPLPGMSDETYALLLSSDDEEEEDEEGEEGEGGGSSSHPETRRRKVGKLTRAERNRIRRRKQAEMEAKLKKQHKALEKQANRAKELAKALDKQKRKEEGQQQQQQEGGGGRRRRRGGKTAADTKPKMTMKKRPVEAVVLPREKNPIQRRSVDLPLADEIGGGLRLLHPVGSLAIDQLEALQKGGRYEVTSVRRRQRPKKRVKYVEKKDPPKAAANKKQKK